MYIAIHSNYKLTETFCLRLLVIFCFSFNSFSSIQFLICIGKRTVYQSAISSIARLLYHNEFCLSSVFSNFFKKKFGNFRDSKKLIDSTRFSRRMLAYLITIAKLCQTIFADFFNYFLKILSRRYIAFSSFENRKI